MKTRKVFVSGCFDMLHSGHVRFLEDAARYGQITVGIGSDETIHKLKGRYPINSQAERQYLLSSLKHVKSCVINKGSGVLDFSQTVKDVRPHVFVVNTDGHTLAKQRLCKQLGIKYVVLQRTPHGSLPARSTSDLRQSCRIPYRIDLAGGWLDQPFVSKFCSGPVLTICIEPTIEFNERSGMASSSRKRAIDLWETDIPSGDREKLARVLFTYENPPGTKEFSGSQDAIGIVFPGLNRLDYQGDYWPSKITSVTNDRTLRWLEQHICLVSLGPRQQSFRVLAHTKLSVAGATALAASALNCWKAINDRNSKAFGREVRKTFEAQIRMFPHMVDKQILKMISQYSPYALGWKLSGAGGGGYLVLITRSNIPGSARINIRRNEF